MLDKTRAICGVLLLLFALSACAAMAAPAPGAAATGALYEAVARGLIAHPYTAAQAPPIEPVPVRVGTIERTLNMGLSAFFWDEQVLHFASGGGYFSGHFTQVGQRVQAGELLAVRYTSMELFGQPVAAQRTVPTVPTPTYLSDLEAVAEYALYHQYRAFAERFATEYQRRVLEIDGLYRAMAPATEEEMLLLSLQRQRAVIQLERFLAAGHATRQHYHDLLLGLAAVQDRLYAPTDGVVTFVSPRVPRDPVQPSNPAVVRIIDEANLLFRVHAQPHAMQFGHTYTAEIRVSEDTYLSFLLTPAFCPLSRAMAPLALGETARVIPAGAHVLGRAMAFTLVLVDPEGFDYALHAHDLTRHCVSLLVGSVTVALAPIENAVLIPADMVRRNANADSYVFVYDNGRLLRRYVFTGVQWQGEVQIHSGLYAGQWVARP